MPKILVADTTDGDRRIVSVLAGHQVTFVRTLGEAQGTLAREKFALVLIGVHFDDSRMFDLLRHLQATRGQGDVQRGCAVICMRSQHFNSPAITIEGLEIAVKALGCNLFLDLTWYAEDAGGNTAIRTLLEALLKP
jgi:CheY-like chemotaxis protein